MEKPSSPLGLRDTASPSLPLIRPIPQETDGGTRGIFSGLCVFGKGQYGLATPRLEAASISFWSELPTSPALYKKGGGEDASVYYIV